MARTVGYGRERSGVDPRGGDWEKEGRKEGIRKEGAVSYVSG